jgi:hypothetical protein
MVWLCVASRKRFRRSGVSPEYRDADEPHRGGRDQHFNWPRPAELSRMDGSFDIQVDSVAEGFRVIESSHGVNFCCSSCDVPVDP